MTCIIGFGIGLILGAWLTPFAFIGTLISGNAGAASVVATSTAASGIVGGISAYGLFKQPKEMIYIDEFVADIEIAVNSL